MPPNSTSLTMNGLANSKRLSGNTALPSNESYHIATDATQPKEPSRPGRTTSAPVSPPATPSSPLPNGTFSCPSPSRHHTQFSTFLPSSAQHGTFDFSQSPLALPGTRVVIHVKPAQHQNMAPHGINGWYVGPFIEHYRCHKCYIPSTFGIRDALTVDWEMP